MTLQYIDILGLNEGTVKGSDFYPAVDVFDPAQSPIGTTKKYLIANLYNFILTQFGFSVLPAAIAATAAGNLNATYFNGPGNNGIDATLTDASGTFAPFVIDGVTGIVDSVPYLIKDQTNQIQNGIYFLERNGDGISIPWRLIRVFYFNSNANIVNGDIIFVTSGTVNANTTWQLTAPSVVSVGVSNLVFNLFTFGPINPQFLPWTDVTSTAISMLANNGYVMDNMVTRVNGILPTTNCPFGSIIEVVGRGNAGWQITQGAGQIIYMNSLNTTTGVGGSLASVGNRATVRLLCEVANTEFQVISSEGNITVV